MCVCVCVCVCVFSGKTRPQQNYAIKLEYKCDTVCISRCKHATNHQIATHSYELRMCF